MQNKLKASAICQSLNNGTTSLQPYSPDWRLWFIDKRSDRVYYHMLYKIDEVVKLLTTLPDFLSTHPNVCLGNPLHKPILIWLTHIGIPPHLIVSVISISSGIWFRCTKNPFKPCSCLDYQAVQAPWSCSKPAKAVPMFLLFILYSLGGQHVSHVHTVHQPRWFTRDIRGWRYGNHDTPNR